MTERKHRSEAEWQSLSICPKCEGESRVMHKAFALLTGQALACIEDQQVIDKILKHMQDKGALPPPPNLLPATRASPDADWFA